MSEACCCARPPPGARRTTDSAEGYLNRYRSGWGAAAAACKAFADETVRRRGKPLNGQPAIPLAELPVPVPVSRFLWPFVRAPLPARPACWAAPWSSVDAVQLRKATQLAVHGRHSVSLSSLRSKAALCRAAHGLASHRRRLMAGSVSGALQGSTPARPCSGCSTLYPWHRHQPCCQAPHGLPCTRQSFTVYVKP